MAIREILRMGDARLLRTAEAVTEFGSPQLLELVADLTETMAAVGGAGLAAPQIGVNLQVVVFGFERLARYPEAPPVALTTLINPVIEALGEDEEEGWEGCLSLPGLRGVVPRWQRIRYRGRDAHGAEIDVVAEGFHARVVQHECDHLRGRLYPMRMRDFSRFGFTDLLFPDTAA